MLRTARLLLRPWREEDFPSFRRLNADLGVMEHFPACLSGGESDALAQRLQQHVAENGWGIWAVEVPDAAPFIGFVGLKIPAPELPFGPGVEIAWRLDFDYWGKGYASEAAKAVLADGFQRLGLAEIVSFTTTGNLRSQAVMERIGMVRDMAGDFDHPALPEGHRLRRHVLYRINARAWTPAPAAPARRGTANGPGS